MLICDLDENFISYYSTQLLATKECISLPSFPAVWWCYRTWELRLVSIQANDNQNDKHPHRRRPAKTSYKMPMWAQWQPVSCRVNSCCVVYTKRRKKTDQRKYSKLDTNGQILSTLVYLHAVFPHTANWLHTIPSGPTTVLSVTLLQWATGDQGQQLPSSLLPRTSYRLFNHSSCYPTRTRLFSGGKVVVARSCLHIFKVWYLSTGKTWRSASGPVTSDNFIRPSSTSIPKTFAAVASNVPETVQRAFVEVQHVASFLAGAGVSGTGWRAYWVWWSGEGWMFTCMCLELKCDEVTCTDGAKRMTRPGLENIF
jgi:hypothetical protein